MRRPVWTRQRRHKQPVTDPVPASLARAAAAIQALAPKALRARGSIAADLPALRSWSPEEFGSAQVWRSEDGEADMWCVLGSSDARSLLRVILQGPAGDEPTPLERNIVRDTVERLLAATGRIWEERAAGQHPPTKGWCCRLTLSDALGTSASFTLHAPADPRQEAAVERVDLRAIPVMLEAMLPMIALQVDSIARWRVGEIVALASPPDAVVSLRAGAACVASGSLGAMRGRRAILVAGET